MTIRFRPVALVGACWGHTIAARLSAGLGVSLLFVLLQGCGGGHIGGGQSALDTSAPTPGDTGAPPADVDAGDPGTTSAGDNAEPVVDADPESPGEASDSGFASLAGCRLFPVESMWNTPVDTAPVHPRSQDYLRRIGLRTPVHPDFGAPYDGAPNGIPFMVVPQSQAMVPVSFTWADESDQGPYPVPFNAPIEGGPDGDGDRHVLVLQQGTCMLYEMFNAWPHPPASWSADAGIVWNLAENRVLEAGRTSADAAGLAILPGLVRYDEVTETGEIRHALRVTLEEISSSFIPPASHSESLNGCGTAVDCPPMGLRLRLRADFDVQSFPASVRVILRAMQKYGLVVVDGGGPLFVSGEPNDAWNDDELHDLERVTAADLEVVYTADAISE